jgi:co-chaperonin GroES (HSP10)
MPEALRPLFDQVVIKELEPDRMRKSGLLMDERLLVCRVREILGVIEAAAPPDGAG